MEIHLISRSNWHEPPRLRQQLASLLSKEYVINYYQPNFSEEIQEQPIPKNLKIRNYSIITRFGSTPIVTTINSFLIYNQIRKNLKKFDLIINFLPEFPVLLLGRKAISVINDDLGGIQKKPFRWWYEFLVRLMAEKSRSVLYVSTRLENKYPSKSPLIIYPWASKITPSFDPYCKKNILLYWGHVHSILDFSVIEEIICQINNSKKDIKFLMVGPISHDCNAAVNQLRRYSCFETLPATQLEKLPIDKIICGVELLKKSHQNSWCVEYPNKAPRLLSFGIPILYSGASLLDLPFFIKYEGDIISSINFIENNRAYLYDLIRDHISQNTEAHRLNSIKMEIDKIRCIEGNAPKTS